MELPLLEDLLERLKQMEETYLVELLGLRSSDIVEAFREDIEVNFEDLCNELEEWPNDTCE